MLNLNLKNKVVLITGASQGMGFEIAKAFSMQGAKVFLVSRNKQKLKIAVNNIKKKRWHSKLFKRRCFRL